MDFVGILSSVIPVPGLEIERVYPIPTPAVVPSPTDSVGLKYNWSFNRGL